MYQIEPFQNINDAISNLDNGGRFFNLFTKANDGIITKAELGKSSKIFKNLSQMILFLELSMSKLNNYEKSSIISKLEENLQKIYLKYKPLKLLPSEGVSKGIIASNAIITGIPKLTESKSDLTGFIMIPMTSGNVTTVTPIPLIDVYDVYKLRDEKSDQNFLIAHHKGTKKLPEKKIMVAGILKELKLNENKLDSSPIYLEAVYYMESN